MTTKYKVTLELEFGDMNAVVDALSVRLDELTRAAADAERRADERKARGLDDSHEGREVDTWLARAQTVRAALAAIEKWERA